jgi:hypothetical protein
VRGAETRTLEVRRGLREGVVLHSRVSVHPSRFQRACSGDLSAIRTQVRRRGFNESFRL